MKFKKPEKLKQGDKVAIISPSWGGPSKYSRVYENGLRILKERFGLEVVEFPTARMPEDELYKNPKIRAKDINDAFADKSIKAIITSIGGDDSIRILKYINKRTIKKNPKIFMGFSDAASVNMYLNQLGIVTFNGPMIMAGFSQIENFPEGEQHIKEILFNVNETYEYRPFPEWTMKYPDWGMPRNVGKVRKEKRKDNWHWIQGNSTVRGKLFGGCIEIFEMMNGTPFWPDLKFWENKILFFETSEEKPSPDYVKYALRTYGIQGILDKIKAIVIGRPRDYTEKESKQLDKNIKEVVSIEFNRPEMPILTNVDFGHTDPQFIMPLGIEAEIDCNNKTFKLLESPVK